MSEDATHLRTYAVITCHNEKPSVLRCLDHLKRTNPEISVVLVDDGSTDGTAYEVQVLHPDVLVVKGDGSLWWSGATNLGIEEALSRGATEILFLNNDCVLPQRGISELILRCSQNPKTIVSASIGDLADGSPVCFGGHFTRLGLEYLGSPPPTDEQGLATVDWLPGHAVVIPASVFQEIGGCDERRFPQYFGDADFFLRARRAGYRLATMPSFMVLNDRSQTGIRLLLPIRPKNLCEVLTHRRSTLRLPENINFYWRHRDLLSVSQFLGRYERIPIALIQEVLDKLHLRSAIRRFRHRRNLLK